MTRSQLVAADIAALLRARNPLIWIVTKEESRVERYLVEAAGAAGFIPITWDVAQGAQTIEASPKQAVAGSTLNDPSEVLTEIATRSRRPTSGSTIRTRNAWILRDLPVWLSGPTFARELRQLRNLTRSLPGAPRETAQAMVILSPSGNVPDELAGIVTVVEWPLPDRDEVAAFLDSAIASLPEFHADPKTKQFDTTRPLRAAALPPEKREAAIDAAVGLSGDEIQACYARSLVQTLKIDPAAVANEKKRVIARERVLEWYDPLPGGLEAVGGLEALKEWLLARSVAYTPAARAYGLPAPKGALLVGIPGCGKSLTAKAIATAWGVPLLRFDLGAQKSKFVGESEGNMRKAFRVVDAVGRCVVWFDEIEKGLAGATDGSADGGVSSDALGSMLQWMQDRRGDAFVIATANDVTKLPPELLRKGRFDNVWFVGLPDAEERGSVLEAALRNYGRDPRKLLDGPELRAVAAACEGFTGSEVAELVPDAMFTAFGTGSEPREVTADDLLAAAKSVVPLSKTAADKIEKLRAWAQNNARPASRRAQESATGSGTRVIEI